MTMHLAWHHGSAFPACDPQLPTHQAARQHTTMIPGDVDCGNCKRTRLYRVAVRVTEQVAAIRQAAVSVDAAIEAVNRAH
jgi:hypothetical protein